MNYLILALLSFAALAAPIQVEKFDQSKLENLLKRIPNTLVKTEDQTKFVRKTYHYTADVFTIHCESDYYQGSPVASFIKCTTDVKDDSTKVNNEYILEIKDPAVVAVLYPAIPDGKDVKKLYSTEKVWNKFRYSFVCQKESCKVTFATLPPQA
jgi:hypothetical protein